MFNNVFANPLSSDIFSVDLFTPTSVTQFVEDPYYKPKYSLPIITSEYTDTFSLVPLGIDKNAVFFNSLTNPIVSSVNFDYNNPMYVQYDNLNTQKHIQDKIIKYFRYKLLDKWIYGELLDILNYFKINSNGQIDILSNMKEYDVNRVQKDSKENIKRKINFVEDFFLTSKAVKKILERYMLKKKVTWIKLPKYEESVKKYMASELVKNIKKNIEHKKSR